MSGVAQWPELAWNDWADTADTLHMWTQIVGKTRLALTPLQNHWWNVPLYVTARGLGTSAMNYGDDVLDIEFDFVAHELHLRMSSGANQSMKLKPRTVADFYAEYLGCLKQLGVSVKIDPMPCELAKPIRFDLDTEHASLRSGVRAPLLAGVGPRGEGLSRLGNGFPRQGKPGALLLGQLRPRSDPVLRPPSAAQARS